ncbi:MAG: hypothetical protein ACAH83_09685 [Alphaproteobacteria bacterium]
MASKFHADYSKILSWDEGRENAPSVDEPFVSVFASGEKQLHYIAAKHGGDIDSPTLKTVKQEFDAFKPDVVIIEGAPNTGEKSPAWYLEYAREMEKSKFAGGGEGTYAAVLAADCKIDFVPGEPTARELLEGMRAQGFTTQDLLGWHVAGMIKSRFADGSIDDANADARIERTAQNRINEFGLKDVTFKADDFRRWYRDRMGKDFSLAGAAADDGAPSSRADANFMQKIMAAADKVREPHIVQVIEEQLSQHDKVLVVYGSGHAIKQEPALESMLGKPKHLKMF